jgi:hypothetical protein
MYFIMLVDVPYGVMFVQDDFDGVGPMCYASCPAGDSIGMGPICCAAFSDCTSRVVELAVKLPCKFCSLLYVIVVSIYCLLAWLVDRLIGVVPCISLMLSTGLLILVNDSTFCPCPRNR